MSLKCEAAAYSHIGGRKNNEDNFFMNGIYMQRTMRDHGGKCEAEFGDGTQIYAVCDGMGGAVYGEEASLLAVETLKNYKGLCAQPDNSGNLTKLCSQMDRAINELASVHGAHPGESGTTIAMLILRERTLRTVHLGDSRIYRLRNGVLERLTTDHSQVQMMIDAGQLTADKAWRHPLKNIITKHLGMPKDNCAKPDIGPRAQFAVDDRYIICSDGLNDVMRDEMIAEIASSDKSCASIAEELVQRALQEAAALGVASDNITVVCLKVKELGERISAARRIRRLEMVKVLYGAAMALSLTAMCWLGTEIIRYIIR